ncbi:MAG TPA: hypothetical protein DCE42_23640 [Myxococcales bacterium]|nr:hypothetical protein [Deltaproteobacteria bacterium]HAA57780.1 hypothetical protein [Myxococcales bacterium]|tara:strand:+ start:3172 stop:4500 length:1329 start_codon:yes stop_codon:yes gene_type:complete
MKIEYSQSLASQAPWEFTIQYPPRPAYFREHFSGVVSLREKVKRARFLLYIHVPFCERKCFYCNFAVDVRDRAEVYTRYVDHLLRQLDALEEEVDAQVDIGGIDIGGGTPTRLPLVELERLLVAVAPWKRRSDHAFPLSIETTPRIASEEPEKLGLLVERGVDRISMGIQSTNEETLEEVNRRTGLVMIERAAKNLRLAGAKRINADLIFALPGQSMEDWKLDLHRVIEMGFDSITTYDCLYRGVGRVMNRHSPDIPEPSVYQEMYDVGYALLTAHGYHARYGSVNFSRYPDETGTSAYFEGRLLDGEPYLGIGNYATSLFDWTWSFAPYRVRDWERAIDGGDVFPVGDGYVLPEDEVAAKYILLSLNFGVIDSRRFARIFGVPLEERYDDELSFALEQGWLVSESKGVYTLSEGHFGHMPHLRSLFYSLSALQWMQKQKTR